MNRWRRLKFKQLIFGKIPLWVAAAMCVFPLYVKAKPTQDLAPGQVVERLEVLGDPTQSYAIYLPSGYSTNRKWPILYCFDPGGRGSLPVKLFKSAAEKYGYIVVGSNNSRNGPNVSLSLIIQTLWDDTHKRFAVDERRVFAAGLSGGARVAASFGLAYKDAVAGVIACSGGFPSNVVPTRDTPFVYFATAGTDDFNNPELQKLDRAFSSLEKPHRLEVFEGGHEWAPAEVCMRAIEWMDLQSMLRGKREKVQAEIEDYYARRLKEGDELFASGKLYESYLAYSGLAQDFAGTRDLTELKGKLAALKGNKDVRSTIKAENELEERQARRSQEFFQIRQVIGDPEKKTEALSNLKSMISELKKMAARPAQSAERMLGRRLLSVFFVGSYEQATNEMFLKKYAEAVIDYSICIELQPDNARAHFNLAKAFLSLGDLKKARESLKFAEDKGFSDTNALDELKRQLAL